MQLKYLPYVLIFVILLRTCVEAELVNNHQWKDILPYLNTKYFQQSRPSLFATANNTLCSQHFQIYLDQINVSYWAMQSEYFVYTLIISVSILRHMNMVSTYLVKYPRSMLSEM
jgi:hypothetical protein